MTADSALIQTSERVEQLLDELAGSDPDTHQRAEEAIRLLVEIYGAALGRIVDCIDPGPVGNGAGDDVGNDDLPPLERLLDDGLVASLLILHDLHPVDTTERIQQALEKVRPYLGSHSGDVELMSVDNGVALLRLRGNCDGCPSSTVTVKGSIERAIAESAPEIEEVRVEGMTDPEPADFGFVPLDTVRHRPPEHAMACTVPAELAGPVSGREEGTA